MKYIKKYESKDAFKATIDDLYKIGYAIKKFLNELEPNLCILSKESCYPLAHLNKVIIYTKKYVMNIISIYNLYEDVIVVKLDSAFNIPFVLQHNNLKIRVLEYFNHIFKNNFEDFYYISLSRSTELINKLTIKEMEKFEIENNMKKFNI